MLREDLSGGNPPAAFRSHSRKDDNMSTSVSCSTKTECRTLEKKPVTLCPIAQTLATACEHQSPNAEKKRQQRAMADKTRALHAYIANVLVPKHRRTPVLPEQCPSHGADVDDREVRTGTRQDAGMQKAAVHSGIVEASP
ncbi:unnamed protein product [Ectocarpus fasciculatus]